MFLIFEPITHVFITMGKIQTTIALFHVLSPLPFIFLSISIDTVAPSLLQITVECSFISTSIRMLKDPIAFLLSLLQMTVVFLPSRKQVAAFAVKFIRFPLSKIAITITIVVDAIAFSYFAACYYLAFILAAICEFLYD